MGRDWGGKACDGVEGRGRRQGDARMFVMEWDGTWAEVSPGLCATYHTGWPQRHSSVGENVQCDATNLWAICPI